MLPSPADVTPIISIISDGRYWDVRDRERATTHVPTCVCQYTTDISCAIDLDGTDDDDPVVLLSGFCTETSVDELALPFAVMLFPASIIAVGLATSLRLSC